ncbi:MAG: ABC transporter ATP-binding protein [Nitrospirota bacterium]|nr:MAG: ABC transporter ATP-binding protein [Nitrospirota bacterium]
MAPLLNVRHLKTYFGGGDFPVRAVDDVQLSIARGETFALVGESGCGKSVTALSLMRLVPEPAGRIIGGTVELDGMNILSLPEMEMRSIRGGRMAMIFQEPMTSLNPVMTIGSQIGESLALHLNISGRQQHTRVIELLEQVGIPDASRRVDEFPHQLSGGMKQRVMIAMALAGQPELLIADEPTTALDVTIQAQILELLKELQQRTGMSILLITHDLGIVADMADRVGVMYAGQIVEQAEKETFLGRPMHPYSQALFQSLPSYEKRHQSLSVIPGFVPKLQQKFTHCRFADRCEHVFDRCWDAVPGWNELNGKGGVRCFLYDEPAMKLQGESRETGGVVPSAVVSPVSNKIFLDVQDLKVHFPIQRGVFKRTVGYVRAVDGVTLQIREGQTLALVGESGCGKTTIGMGILQLLRPTSGQVNLEDIDLLSLDPGRLRATRQDMQIIFQDPFSSMNPRMLVNDIIGEGLVTQGVGREERHQEVENLLQLVGLNPEMKNRYPHEFSGGQRQRIAIARAIAVKPKFIVCDEPTSALDVSVQAQILNLLKDLQQKLGLTYLFITHNISVVAYLADEIAIMYLGRIVEYGSVERVLNQPRHPYTQALLSAVPQIDSTIDREVIRLQGDIPSPSNPPQGCHFHPRCPKVINDCRRSYPEWVRLHTDQSARCIRMDSN